uniref:MyTH4 domain-containing protein n=1 Tax=Macrostomum lignano TaxID=282301 RepID=A0A1I8F7A5_9PLAT
LSSPKRARASGILADNPNCVRQPVALLCQPSRSVWWPWLTAGAPIGPRAASKMPPIALTKFGVSAAVDALPAVCAWRSAAGSSAAALAWAGCGFPPRVGADWTNAGGVRYLGGPPGLAAWSRPTRATGQFVNLAALPSAASGSQICLRVCRCLRCARSGIGRRGGLSSTAFVFAPRAADAMRLQLLKSVLNGPAPVTASATSPSAIRTAPACSGCWPQPTNPPVRASTVAFAFRNLLACQEHLGARPADLAETCAQLAACADLIVRCLRHRVPLTDAEAWIYLHRHFVFLIEETEKQINDKSMDTRQSNLLESAGRLLILAHQLMHETSAAAAAAVPSQQPACNAGCQRSDGRLLHYTVASLVPLLLRQQPPRTTRLPGRGAATPAPAGSGIIDAADGPPVSIDWETGRHLMRYYLPDKFPEFDSHRLASLPGRSGALLRLGRRWPADRLRVDANAVNDFLFGGVDTLPEYNRPLTPDERLTADIHYLLADCCLKSNRFLPAIKHYLRDLALSPDRFDSWAGMALARCSRLQQKLNLQDGSNSSSTVSRKYSLACLRSFDQALRINPLCPKLLTERGLFAYELHSHASQLGRRGKQLELAAEWRLPMLRLARESFLQAASAANHPELRDAGEECENWLYNYMLGKCCEKSADHPDICLGYYAAAANELRQSGRRYPKRISTSYGSTPRLAVEALEMQYRQLAIVCKQLLMFLPRPKSAVSSPTTASVNLSWIEARLIELSKSAFQRRDALGGAAAAAAAKDRSVDMPAAAAAAEPGELILAEVDSRAEVRQLLNDQLDVVSAVHSLVSGAAGICGESAPRPDELLARRLARCVAMATEQLADLLARLPHHYKAACLLAPASASSWEAAGGPRPPAGARRPRSRLAAAGSYALSGTVPGVRAWTAARPICSTASGVCQATTSTGPAASPPTCAAPSSWPSRRPIGTACCRCIPACASTENRGCLVDDDLRWLTDRSLAAMADLLADERSPPTPGQLLQLMNWPRPLLLAAGGVVYDRLLAAAFARCGAAVVRPDRPLLDQALEFCESGGAGYSNGLAGCAPSVCIGNCPVWTGAGIRADLRLSEGGAPRWLLAALRLKLCRSCPHKHTCHLAATAAAAANSLAARPATMRRLLLRAHQSLSQAGAASAVAGCLRQRPVDGDSSSGVNRRAPRRSKGEDGGEEPQNLQELLRDYDKKSRPVVDFDPDGATPKNSYGRGEGRELQQHRSPYSRSQCSSASMRLVQIWT